jgi:oligopeptide transport system ATP-binding protein
MALLQVEDLQVFFHIHNGIIRAVDGLSFELEAGQCIGIVGESGSGKSAAMMALLRLLPTPPAKIHGGRALLHGQDLLTMPDAEIRKIRGNKIAMIFQDPMTSLNPYLRIATQMCEVLQLHQGLSKKSALVRSIEALERVGIPDAARNVQQYPHQFSGGMRQRVMIAMAILTRAEIIIADEPTTALDVTIQAQIIELLKEMQRQHGLSLILVTHDLGVVAGVSDQLLVMYNGRLVEKGSVETLYYKSEHPYTQGLLNARPRVDQAQQRLMAIPGAPPASGMEISGCAFAPRCPKVMERCTQPVPWVGLGDGHYSLCHLCAARASEVGYG